MPISLTRCQKAVAYFPMQDTLCTLSRPGVGKSKMIEAAASTCNAYLVTIYALIRDAVDAKGLPYIERSEKGAIVRWAIPSEFPVEELMDQFPTDREIWFFLDDLFHAADSVQKTFARTFFERLIGESKMLPNCRVFVAGNRTEDRAGVVRSPSYVNDRLTFIEAEPEVEEWVAGSLSGFAVPPFDARYPEVRAAVDKAVKLGTPEWLISYVGFNKQISDFDPQRRSNFGPRSIERAGRIVRAFEAARLDDDTLAEAMGGTISPEHAEKAMAFRRMARELPDIEGLLRGENVPLPHKPEVLYMTSLAVLRGASEKKETKALGKLILRLADHCDRSGSQIGVEIAAYLFNESLRSTSGLQKIMHEKEVQEFVRKHQKTIQS
jgi:hypothetical protein